jgi:hypothetical protein
VLSLAKKHGPAVIEDAAKAALELCVPTYRFLRRYLERRPPVPLTLKQVDPLIRQLTVAVGARANLVVLRGDSTANISDVRRVEWVMKDGLAHDTDALAWLLDPIPVAG